MNARIGLAVAGIALVTAFAAPDVLAHGRQGGRGHGHGYGHHHHGHAVAPHGVVAAPYVAPVIAPRVIVPARAGYYAPYRYRSVWYGPHQHSHVVYRFPVATAYGVVYEPHTYCGSALYVDGHGFDGYVEFRTPHVSVGVGF